MHDISCMAFNVLLIQNDPDVPAGVFGQLLQEWQVSFRVVRAGLEDLPMDKSSAVIVLGGTMGVHEEDRHPFLPPVKEFIRRKLADQKPLLGICLGGQLLAEAGGGVVYSNSCGEKGLVNISLTSAGVADPLFANIEPSLNMFQWHNDSFTLPPGARHLARSVACHGQAFRLANAWGVQFHPEVDLATVSAWSRQDPDGKALEAAFALAESEHRVIARQMLSNFLVAARQLIPPSG